MKIRENLSERIHLRVDAATKKNVMMMSRNRRMTQKQVVLLALENLFAS
jgi:hypothetical protein